MQPDEAEDDAYVPEAQYAQLDAPATAYVPAMQTAHTDDPALLANVPASHAVQMLAPTDE